MGDEYHKADDKHYHELIQGGIEYELRERGMSEFSWMRHLMPGCAMTITIIVIVLIVAIARG